MRVYKRGKNWYIDYFYKGKRYRRKISRSKKVAELTLKDIEVKIAKGEFLGIHEEKKVLFEDFAKEYLEFSETNKAPESYRRDKDHLGLHLIPYFKEKYLFEITSQEIEKYKTERLKRLKPATVNRQLACLKHMFNKAIEWGYVKNNPMKDVRMLKEPPGRIRYLMPDEISALLRECAPHIRPIVITALHTGMRKSEILNLKWSNIDLKRRLITIETTKNNECRTIPINDVLYEELRKIPRHFRNHMVFYNKDGENYYDIKKGFQAAVKRAGVKDFRFHDLRHTFASYLVMSGVDIRTVQQLLGHKDIKMTLRYSHLSKTHLQDAVNKVGTNLAQIENSEISKFSKSL
jgi:integrase